MHFIFSLLAFCFLSITPASAGDITLNADKSVEYHQKEQKLVAEGNAVASKDDMIIKAERLIGWYAPKSKNKISRVEAHQNVRMSSSQAKAFGDKLVYDIKEDSAILTGSPARIKLPDADITALGSITYYQSKQKAIAQDNVVAIDNKGNKVYADLMTAWFKKDAADKMTLDKIDIEQNVKIVSKDATITALKGVYYASSGKIKLFDNIVINQNGNILKGSKAETNLNTGVSKILSGNAAERVSGIFKEKKKQKE